MTLQKRAQGKPLLNGQEKAAGQTKVPKAPEHVDIGNTKPCEGDECPVSGKAASAGTCPIQAFQLPKDGYSNHPGGQNHLKTAQEADCTGLMFLSYHVGCDLEGRISASAKALGIKIPETGPFYRELHGLVRRIKEEQKAQHSVFVAWCLTITAVTLACIVWFLRSPDIFAAVSMAFCLELYFFNIFHTRHHKGGKLYDIKWLDSITAPLYEGIDNTWGYFPKAWWTNHHVLHHMHTNETAEHVDPDLPATYPLIRMFSRQERYWFHKLQTFYWPLLLLPSAARFPLQNYFLHGGSIVYFLAWLLVMFFIPGFCHGMQGVAMSIFAQGLTGLTLTYKFAVSHAHEDLVPHSEGKTELLNTSKEMKVDAWLANQIEESISWGGYWSTLIFGGINMQIEHHLAPALDPPLLWYLSKEMKPLCKKHGIRYTSEPSMFHATLKLHTRLWKMGWLPTQQAA